MKATHKAILHLRAVQPERRRGSNDDLDQARCPLCRQVLVARMGRYGPEFPCRCTAGKKK